MGRSRRRQFLFTPGALLAAPLASQAQPESRIWCVAYLSVRSMPTSIETDMVSAIPQGIRELGYIEAKNLIIEWRFADDDSERPQELAVELVRLKANVLMSGSSLAVRALRRATTSIPIVMATSGDPVRASFVKSLARPGGNITAVACRHECAKDLP